MIFRAKSKRYKKQTFAKIFIIFIIGILIYRFFNNKIDLILFIPAILVLVLVLLMIKSEDIIYPEWEEKLPRLLDFPNSNFKKLKINFSNSEDEKGIVVKGDFFERDVNIIINTDSVRINMSCNTWTKFSISRSGLVIDHLSTLKKKFKFKFKNQSLLNNIKISDIYPKIEYILNTPFFQSLWFQKNQLTLLSGGAHKIIEDESLYTIIENLYEIIVYIESMKTI